MTDGLVLIGTVLASAVIIDVASYRWPWFARLARPPSVLLVDRGRVVSRNLRRELMALDELRGQLREQGIERISEVQAARMESDGRISIIAREAGARSQEG